jgi:hypothetical protein
MIDLSSPKAQLGTLRNLIMTGFETLSLCFVFYPILSIKIYCLIFQLAIESKCCYGLFKKKKKLFLLNPINFFKKIQTIEIH